MGIETSAIRHINAILGVIMFLLYPFIAITNPNIRKFALKPWRHLSGHGTYFVKHAVPVKNPNPNAKPPHDYYIRLPLFPRLYYYWVILPKQSIEHAKNKKAMAMTEEERTKRIMEMYGSDITRPYDRSNT